MPSITTDASMLSFTSPTNLGMRRSGGVVFPRAQREIAKPVPESGDIAQVCGCVFVVFFPHVCVRARARVTLALRCVVSLCLVSDVPLLGAFNRSRLTYMCMCVCFRSCRLWWAVSALFLPCPPCGVRSWLPCPPPLERASTGAPQPTTPARIDTVPQTMTQRLSPHTHPQRCLGQPSGRALGRMGRASSALGPACWCVCILVYR